MDSDHLHALREHIDASMWHNITGETALEHLRTGLTSEEAQLRLAAFGSNELTKAPHPTLWARFLDQFKNFLDKVRCTQNETPILRPAAGRRIGVSFCVQRT